MFARRAVQWRFSADTVAALPEVWKVISEQEELKEGLEGAAGAGELVLQRAVPKSLRKEWLGLARWQWLALLILLIAGVMLDFVVRIALGAVIVKRFHQQGVDVDRKLRINSLRPLGLIVMGLLWWKSLAYLLLPDHVHVFLFVAAKGITVLAAIWAVSRLIDLLGAYLAGLAEKTESRYDDLLVPLIRRTLKIALSAVGLVFLADIFQWQLGHVLAGLGIGGLAIGFAAREVLQNFFGSITILIDRPFHIGDWVKIGDSEGTVEEVGFRSTRIRTFYNSLITIPNGALLTAEVDNLGARHYRRIKTKLSVTYDTPPAKIDAFCEGIRELIRRHPYTRKDYFHVYFNEFGPSSLEILLYCFHRAPDWGTELRERHRLFNDIIRLARKLDVEFAFPTQTLHLHQTPASAETVPDIQDPAPEEKLGQQIARQLVRDAGLEGTVPPPVIFGPTVFDEAEQDGDGA